MKVDLEGAELAVLNATQVTLSHILGVGTELNMGPARNPDNLAGIDALLRWYGLYLFDIDIARYPLKALPWGYLSYETNGFRIDLQQEYGQIGTGDTVYLRDLVFERDNGLECFEWNEANVLKMAMLHELYLLRDCAIELLQGYQASFPSSLPFDHFYDLLTTLMMEGYKRHWVR